MTSLALVARLEEFGLTVDAQPRPPGDSYDVDVGQISPTERSEGTSVLSA